MLLVLIALLLEVVAATEPGRCVARGSKFKEFEPQAPRKSQRGPKDLSLCRIYRGKTCCTASQTDDAVAALGNLARHGEASGECLGLWEALECSICDPRVGVSPGPPLLCHNFCESVYKACSSAFFAMHQTKQVLLPCRLSELLCFHGSKWTKNSSEFCELAGFGVGSKRSSGFCFDGTVELDSISSSSAEEKKHVQDSRITIRKLYKRLKKAFKSDNVFWSVGCLLVLTALAIYLRHRGYRARARRMALMKTIHEARTRQQAAQSASSRGLARNKP